MAAQCAEFRCMKYLNWLLGLLYMAAKSAEVNDTWCLQRRFFNDVWLLKALYNAQHSALTGCLSLLQASKFVILCAYFYRLNCMISLLKAPSFKILLSYKHKS